MAHLVLICLMQRLKTSVLSSDDGPVRKLNQKMQPSSSGIRRQLQTGDRTVLAVRVIAKDGEYNFTENVLSDKIFGTFGDEFNLKSQTAACSYNQLTFNTGGFISCLYMNIKSLIPFVAGRA